jgi:hypothetical protein
LINLTSKKVYCPKCQVLVHVKKQKTGEKENYICIKCNTVVWQKESNKWKYNKNVV